MKGRQQKYIGKTYNTNAFDGGGSCVRKRIIYWMDGGGGNVKNFLALLGTENAELTNVV